MVFNGTAAMELDNICIVLVGTLYGGNVGSACRAMANMGVSHLRLVAPDPYIKWDEAERMACHAEHILEGRQTYETLAEAVSDCVAVAGASAREGLYRQHAHGPREVAPELAALAEKGHVAIVFGREDKGLFNDEISICTHLIRIPTSTEESSLNLSQAVMVVCYELFSCLGKYEPLKEKSELASAALRQRMFELWRNHLLRIGFMDEEKADHMMAGFNRIFSRGALTQDDVKILMGVIRQNEWAVEHLHELEQTKNEMLCASGAVSSIK